MPAVQKIHALSLQVSSWLIKYNYKNTLWAYLLTYLTLLYYLTNNKIKIKKVNLFNISDTYLTDNNKIFILVKLFNILIDYKK